MNLILFLIIGAVAGFLFSFIGVDMGNGLIGSLITATIGAVVLLWLISFIKKA